MGGSSSAVLAAASVVAAASIVAAVSMVAATAATIGIVSCMDLIYRDIYASFAFELVWTIIRTCMHYLWLWMNDTRLYLLLCTT